MPNLSMWASWAQIVSLPIALVAVLVSIWLYRRGRQRRALACEFGTIVSPIEIRAGEALRGELEIRYKGQNVENLFLVRAKLKNIGTLPIRKSHVIEPVTFAFETGVELLREPEPVHKKPENLKIDWDFGEVGSTSKPNRVSLTFDLLNPGDELAAEFTCTGKSTFPKVAARIEGIEEIELLEPGKQVSLSQAVSLATIGSLTLAILAVMVVWTAQYSVLGSILFAVGSILIAVSVILRYFLKATGNWP
jgi:hypothetical protein